MSEEFVLWTLVVWAWLVAGLFGGIMAIMEKPREGDEVLLSAFMLFGPFGALLGSLIAFSRFIIWVSQKRAKGRKP